MPGSPFSPAALAGPAIEVRQTRDKFQDAASI
jgi:hypothetical protein